MEEAVKILTDSPIPPHALGIWHTQVSNIGWVERNVAALLFATPPASTYQNGIEWFLKAHEMASNVETWAGFLILNSCELASCYELNGDKTKALEWYEKCLSYKAQHKGKISAQQEASLAKAAERIAAIKSAWW